MRNLSSLIITGFVHRRWLVWQNTEKVVNHLFRELRCEGYSEPSLYGGQNIPTSYLSSHFQTLYISAPQARNRTT